MNKQNVIVGELLEGGGGGKRVCANFYGTNRNYFTLYVHITKNGLEDAFCMKMTFRVPRRFVYENDISRTISTLG